MLNKQVMPMMTHVDLRIPLRAPNPLMTSQFLFSVFAKKKRSRDHSLLFLFALSHVVTRLEREYNTFITGCKRNYFPPDRGLNFAEKPWSMANRSGAIHCHQKF
jgi:hypothetical protein